MNFTLQRKFGDLYLADMKLNRQRDMHEINVAQLCIVFDTLQLNKKAHQRD